MVQSNGDKVHLGIISLTFSLNSHSLPQPNAQEMNEECGFPSTQNLPEHILFKVV